MYFCTSLTKPTMTMSRKYILFIIITLLSICGYTQTVVESVQNPAEPVRSTRQAYRLSDSAYATLVTCGPGEDFYTAFGHTALHLCDSTKGIDVVYNYGCFDFDAPHFYLNFARGQMDYFATRVTYASFLMEYMFEGRAVWEQRLLLSTAELETLFMMLEENVKPENKYYKYDFFRDNCATRVRDKIEMSLQGRQLADTVNHPAGKESYRSLVHKYTDGVMEWWQLGIDLLLGARCDRELTAAEYMYVPMEMMNQYDTTLLRPAGGLLAEPVKQVLEESRAEEPTRLSPTLFFWILFILVGVLTLVGRKYGWRMAWLDAILFGAAGLVSLLLLFLWFGSDHYCTKWNLNLLWANPLMLWMVCRLRKGCKVVSLVVLGCLLIVLAGWFWLPQEFNAAVLPLVLMLMVRCLGMVRIG